MLYIVDFYNSKSRRGIYKLVPSFISEEVTISSSLPSALITIKIFSPKGDYNNVNIV